MTTPSKPADDPTAAGPTGKVPAKGDLPETTAEDTAAKNERVRLVSGFRADEVKRYEDADDGATLVHLNAGYAVLIDKDGKSHAVTNAKGERVSDPTATETPAAVQGRANEPAAAGGTLATAERTGDAEELAEEAVGIDTDDDDDAEGGDPEETPAEKSDSTSTKDQPARPGATKRAAGGR